jgi:hypothetical protein
MRIKSPQQFSLVVALALFATPLSASLAESAAEVVTPAEQYATITSLVGKWDVQGRDSLKIVFEATAGGSVVVEKWMRGDATHSLTIYHRDGNKIIATHYCPQGNQPRMAATASTDGDIRFTFQDATDLDSKESFQHDLGLDLKDDGTLVRSEIYWGPDGAGKESALNLTRAVD